ncbi:hypothetical protein ACFQ7N_39380 [Streptomyces niveus]|uniref:hypothetical protein n=1 Tax=Streptomyces niveus TaxID=193462 RepID=UPI0036C8D99D
MTAVEEEHGAALEPVKVVDAELVGDGDESGSGAVDVPDPAAAIIAALDMQAARDLYDDRPRKTTAGYARDWELWGEFHRWLAERTGELLPLSTITVGTYVAFVKWLDKVKEAAPNSIERRVTGVASEARRHGYEVPKAARAAATQALKPLKLDKERQKRGRGKAAAITPADLRRMNTSPREIAPPLNARRRRVLIVPELARLRDRSLHTLRFAVAGRNEEMSELDDPHIQLVAEGLEVHVPSVKGRPARDVVVSYGESADSCAVRCWIAWQEAKLAAGAPPDGPAYLPVTQWGALGTERLSPDGCGRAISRSAKYAGMSGRRITGHSGRRGLVTTGRRAGRDEGEKWEGNATEGIM